MIELLKNTNFLIIFFTLFFISTLVFGISIILKFSKKKKLSEADKKELKNIFKNMKVNKSDKEKLIDYDKLYHKILQKFGYNGTFGEILKTKPNEIGNLNKVWELHKLRNKLVHDVDEEIKENLFLKVKEYEKEIEIILK
ncbi:hypothetical protein BLD25_03245 [Candidatus Gracilibacteria bacterium GN02-872]|nr:hypothetical protein BLD25_03245 [Candidatus Gracilibacteria bacterium GN02-872]